MAEWGTSHVLPQAGEHLLSGSGYLVTEETAMGLPAVSSVVRSPADIISSLPFMTYRGRPRRRAEDSWQWDLLHDDPDEQGTGTQVFFYDLEISLEATQNAFIHKAKSSNRVEALYVLDPHRVKVYRDSDTGEKLFDIYVSASETKKRLTTGDILHVRGFSKCPGSVVGTSLLEMHRNPLGSQLALQGFEGDYFRNSAQTPFFFTGAKNREHAVELLALHNERHQGAGKQFRVGALWGDANVQPIPLSLVDAQFVEAKRLTIEDCCRIWRWPKELMELTSAQGGTLPTDENAWTARMLKFYLLPRLKRIERAFASDQDLYKSSGLVGEFLTAALERADFVTRMRGYKDARQGGWIAANEIRDMENMPPHKDGDSILITPTGSAPNPSTSTGVEGADGEPELNGRRAEGAFDIRELV